MLNSTDWAAALRPPAHMLMLMTRAAVAESGNVGPWLTVTRARVGRDESAAYVHHINLFDVPPVSAHRLVMLTGDELLSHALERGWDSITEPTRDQVAALVAAVMERADVEGWAADYDAWRKAYESKTRTYERQARADKAAGDARALRWILAEQWLRGR